MSTDSDLFYGSSQPAQPAAQQPAQPAQQPSASAADAFYSSGGEQPAPTTLHSGEIYSTALASSLQDAVEAGRIELADARALGATLTTETSALGFTGADADTLWRDLSDAPVDERTAQSQRAESVQWLRSEFGPKAEQRLQAATAWMRQTSPNLAAALAAHPTGNSLRVVQQIVRAHAKAIAGGRR